MRARVAIAAAALALVGCTEDVTYSYFEVDVSVDASIDDDTLKQVEYCGFKVKDTAGAVVGQTNLRCGRNSVPRQLGRVGWSTRRTTGQVVFSVEMQDFNHMALGRGDSAAVAVVPNKVTPAAVVVKAVAPVQTDGGVPDGGRKDAGTGDAATGDARADGSADGSSDGSTD